MQLPIEAWMLNARLPREAETALGEAVTCYKGGGYRAALLFSYLAFSLTLRHRVLATIGAPPGFAQAEWNQLHAELIKDEKWDKSVFDATQQRQPTKIIFGVSADLRQQVLYWKDRRNDCAHFKDNEITASHVESFWSFMRSNLGKFVPVGSRESVFQRLVDHFNLNLTPPGMDPTSIVQDIPSSIEASSLLGFFADLTTAFSKVTSFGYAEPASRLNLAVIHDCILRLSDPAVVTALVEYLKRDFGQLTALLERAPGHVQLLHTDPSCIRKLWRSYLFPGTGKGLRIYSALLQNSLIPSAELDEANMYVALNLRGEVPDENDVIPLATAVFFIAFAMQIFEPPYERLDNFTWGNSNAAFLTWYIDKFPVTDQAAMALADVFQRGYHPREAASALRALLQRNTQLRTVLEARMQSLGREMPMVLR